MVRVWSGFLARARNAMRHARKDDGYTLIELVAVMSIMGIIAGTVTTGIAIGMRTMMSVGEISTSESRAANAISEITENVSLATPILAIGRNRLVTLRDMPGRCERHEYVVSTNLAGEPRNLQHTVQRYRTPAGTDCGSLSPDVWTTIPPLLDTVIVDNLVANPEGEPVFAYSAAGLPDVPLPGDDNYTAPADPVGPCEVSRVTITLSAQPTTEEMVQTLRSAASPRSYALGLRC